MNGNKKRLAAFLVAGTLLLIMIIATMVSPKWWRLGFLPTPEEWQATFAGLALAALGLAWYQIKQVDASNKEVARSNESVRKVNLENVRPRVQVFLTADRIVRRLRGAPVTGTIYLTVENAGVTAATNVRMTASAPFESLPEFFIPGGMEKHLDEVNSFFNGDIKFKTLTPGRPYIWILGRAPEIYEAEGIVKKYDIRVQYGIVGLSDTFDETITIDLDLEKRIAAPVDPLVRIGKDLEEVTSAIKGLKK
ncbi:hypothetical protein ITJ42_10185 [Clavibacter michiganensis subsp. phaseoli]|jgi:hypothetical protein|uniref:Uncharacterized protein n=1 Tax=Clavibacter phaseoli TaxID=1734031 RepID=A0A8I0S9V3_9MICO|nr:hypothetical protein [Clavibacter phaseoli]MBF4631581.1 hypothetical protein [Clavibacter phaseoli]